MNTKLTLQLNKKALERAKRYAQRTKQSLSVIVENPDLRIGTPKVKFQVY